MTELHDTGEEYLAKLINEGVSPQNVEVGLYNSSDSLTDSDNLSAVTTEPDTAKEYARQSVTNTNISVDVSGSDAIVDLPEVSFSTNTNTVEVDKYFVVVNFQSDEAGDGSPSDNLFFTGPLSQDRNLNQIETLNVDAIQGKVQ